MEFDFQSWGIGVGTGLLVNWLSHKILRKRRAKGAYIAVTDSSGGIEFEGRAETRDLSTTYSYGEIEYQISVKMETGKAKKEVEIPTY